MARTVMRIMGAALLSEIPWDMIAPHEELARWLADTGASAFGNSTATYEGWLRVAQGGYAPSAVSVNGGPLVSGVDALYPHKAAVLVSRNEDEPVTLKTFCADTLEKLGDARNALAALLPMDARVVGVECDEVTL